VASSLKANQVGAVLFGLFDGPEHLLKVAFEVADVVIELCDAYLHNLVLRFVEYKLWKT
jgi:hypothetical protein